MDWNLIGGALTVLVAGFWWGWVCKENSDRRDRAKAAERAWKLKHYRWWNNQEDRGE